VVIEDCGRCHAAGDRRHDGAREETLIAAAAEAGCTEVMPRSAFFRRLPELLGHPGAPR